MDGYAVTEHRLATHFMGDGCPGGHRDEQIVRYMTVPEQVVAYFAAGAINEHLLGLDDDGDGCCPGGESYIPRPGVPRERTPRPSVHPPLTKSYAIDQIEDIEHLRVVAHRMWEAFFAAHSQAAHAIAALMDWTPCTACMAAISGETEHGCSEWQEWQRKVDVGFGSV